jgi:glycosyltransferase involved in cell wall biosynthesis
VPPSAGAEAGAAPLLVFADDWGRHPSSCQHVVRHLLPRHRVAWVNTIGTRTPRLDLATVRRAVEKARHWLQPLPTAPAAPLPHNLTVHNPRMWPWFTRTLDRRINRRLLLRALVPLVGALPEPPIAVTTLPVVADLMGPLRVRRWVYYCVDDFSLWPGLDQKALGTMEETLVKRADAVIAVSETLQARLAAMGRPSHLLTHGIDAAHWAPAADAETLPQIAGLEQPVVVFWGVIDRRMDSAIVQRLGAELTCGTLLLVGPEDDPDPALRTAPRVVRLPPLPFADLPRLARDAAVLVMPYADLPVTRAMQPLKLKEYLATGKPVVVRRLPATREWGDCLDQADTPAEFAEVVKRRLQVGLSPEQGAARARLAGEGWEEKARLFERWAVDG